MTGDTTPHRIFDEDMNFSYIHHIYTDEVCFAYSSTGEIFNDVYTNNNEFETFILNTCIQSDPGEPRNWKEAILGSEREWWIQSITSEFNNFLSLKTWKFIPRRIVQSKGQKVIPTKLVFKKKDEIDGSI